MKRHEFIEDPISPRFCKVCSGLKFQGDHPTAGQKHMFWNDDRKPETCYCCGEGIEHPMHDEEEAQAEVVPAAAARRGRGGRPKKERGAAERVLLQVQVPSELLERIADFRFAGRYESRAEAVVALLERGLAEEVPRG